MYKTKRARLLLFITVCFVGFDCGQIEAASRSRCALALSATSLIATACGLQGCASPDAIIGKEDGYRTAQDVRVRAKLVDEFQSKLSGRHYEWIIHISFKPYDFGHFGSLIDTELVSENSGLSDILSRRGLPLKDLKAGHSLLIPKALAPQSGDIPSDSPQVILNLDFRHSGGKKAVEALEYLLENPKDTLSKSLIIVSGGSWGASEIGTFASALKNRFGKDIDVVITADGVAWPTPFSMLWVEGVSNTPIKINFYQKNGILHGAALPGFWNLLWDSDSAEHVSAADEANSWGDEIISRILLTDEGPKMVLAQDFWRESVGERMYLRAHPEESDNYYDSKDWKKVAAAMEHVDYPRLLQGLQRTDLRLRMASLQELSKASNPERQGAFELIISAKTAASSAYEAQFLFGSTNTQTTPNYSEAEWKYIDALVIETLRDPGRIQNWRLKNALPNFSSYDLKTVFANQPLAGLQHLANLYDQYPEEMKGWTYEAMSILRDSIKFCHEQNLASDEELKFYFLKVFSKLHTKETWYKSSFSQFMLLETAEKLKIDISEFFASQKEAGKKMSQPASEASR